MDQLLERLTELGAGFNGRFSIAIHDLQTDKMAELHGAEIFPTASIIKLPVLCTLMAQCEAGETSLDEPLMLRRADKIGGSGVLQFLTPGLTMCVRDWAFLMMNISDNLATNVLIDHVGKSEVQAWLDKHGFHQIQLHRKIDFGALAKDQKDLGITSAQQMTQLMSGVFLRGLVSPESCAEVMRMMNKVGSDRIGRYLPVSPYGEDVDDSLKLNLAGKTGSLVGMRGQTAVVWQGEWQKKKAFVLTVLTCDNPEPETWSPDAPGVLFIGRVARAVYDALLAGK